ncbi:MAG: hypothetical protein D6690_12275 [Nitrospirae bacterium]|nr:MAG: hypothetical protein D6690_12275 [Nitrospirota bacterium]
MLLLIAAGLSGCAGKGEIIDLDLQALPIRNTEYMAPPNAPPIYVLTFEDARPVTDRLGVRTHWGGGLTYFTVWGGEMGKGMASLAVEYLQQRGWQATWLRDKAQADALTKGVILSGRILSFAANAKSRFLATDIDVDVKVAFSARNVIDGSTVRMVLGSNGTETVMVFDPEDVRDLTNEVIQELFEELFQDLVIQDGTLRLRSRQS